MKKLLTLSLTLLMLCTLVFTLSSCSTYSKIEKNFLNEGYKVISAEDGEGLDFVADLEEDGEVSCTVHILKKDAVSYAIVLEFGADKDAQARLDELLTDDDYKEFMELDEEAKFIRGNCVLIPFTMNIFDLKGTVSEMVDLFNK